MNQNRALNETKRSRIRSLSLLMLTASLPLAISCSDFIDHPEESQPTSPPGVIAETPKTEPVPQIPPPIEPPRIGDAEGQKNWNLCEAERRWAFTTKLIDEGLLRLYQNRNFAPVFNNPGERQSGIEGWYPCKRSLQMNGFISVEVAEQTERETANEEAVVVTMDAEAASTPPNTEQENWALCEAERRWALKTKQIDADLMRLYQNRNFAPVFNVPGERQSGIEGWYPCKRALQINGFIAFEMPVQPDGSIGVDGPFS